MISYDIIKYWSDINISFWFRDFVPKILAALKSSLSNYKRVLLAILIFFCSSVLRRGSGTCLTNWLPTRTKWQTTNKYINHQKFRSLRRIFATTTLKGPYSWTNPEANSWVSEHSRCSCRNKLCDSAFFWTDCSLSKPILVVWNEPVRVRQEWINWCASFCVFFEGKILLKWKCQLSTAKSAYSPDSPENGKNTTQQWLHHHGSIFYDHDYSGCPSKSSSASAKSSGLRRNTTMPLSARLDA